MRTKLHPQLVFQNLLFLNYCLTELANDKWKRPDKFIRLVKLLGNLVVGDRLEI